MVDGLVDKPVSVPRKEGNHEWGKSLPENAPFHPHRVEKVVLGSRRSREAIVLDGEDQEDQQDSQDDDVGGENSKELAETDAGV